MNSCNHFIYEFMYMNSYTDSYKLWIHMIISYMNSYVFSWIYMGTARVPSFQRIRFQMTRLVINKLDINLNTALKTVGSMGLNNMLVMIMQCPDCPGCQPGRATCLCTEELIKFDKALTKFIQGLIKPYHGLIENLLWIDFRYHSKWYTTKGIEILIYIWKLYFFIFNRSVYPPISCTKSCQS